MPGEDLLKELAQDLTVSEKTSPPLREGLAAIFNNILSEKMGDEKLKAKLEKYPRPENVKGLRTPKVNPSIWSQLSTTIKAQDVRSQKGQNTLIGAITAMTKGADLALGKYSQDKELITLLTDAVAMALQYNHEVNHSRRLAMKKEMHKDYGALCNLSTVDGTSEYPRHFGCRSLHTLGFFSLYAFLDAPCTWLLIMTCASAVLSHVISRLLMSCDRISIKLQLTGKSRLIFQF